MAKRDTVGSPKITAAVCIGWLWVACFLRSEGAWAQKPETEKPTGEEGSQKRQENEAKSRIYTRAYTHNWVPCPALEGVDLQGQPKSFPVDKGVTQVILFLASWCVPCQDLVPEMKKLEQLFQGKNVEFFYVFSHDLVQDASRFAQETGLKNPLLAKHDLLKAFHNPELPSVYVVDEGWLLTRDVKSTPAYFPKLEGLLHKLALY